MKICMVLPCALPMPAVKGGAIENLVYNIVKWNEKYDELDLKVVSVYDSNAVEKSKYYKNTSWIFLKRTAIDIFSDYIFRVLRKIFGYPFRISTYDYKVLKKLKQLDFDRIIFEGGNKCFLTKYQKYFSKEKLIIHMHNVERPKYDICKCTEKVITISNYVREVLLDNSKLKPENVYTILNGVDTKNFSRIPSKEVCESIRKRWGIKREDFVLLYVGRIIKEKGVKELISAVSDLSDVSVKLLLVGQTIKFHKKYAKDIDTMINKLSDRIKLIGYIPNEQLYYYYYISDCVVMPSICEEGAGLVQNEAYAAGKPVIVSKRGGIPEYCLADASLTVEYDTKFVENIKKAIIEMQGLIANKKFDAKSIQQENERYSAETYYLNYVDLLRKEIIGKI